VLQTNETGTSRRSRRNRRPQAYRFWRIRPARGCSVQVSKDR